MQDNALARGIVFGIACGLAWTLASDAFAAETRASESERARPRFVVQDLEAQANAGDAEVMFRLAQALQRGRGVKEDDARAAEWYLRAAESGHAAAMTNLGVMYSRGEGVARDDGRALEWYRKAAAAGSTKAMVMLGTRAAQGQGVAQDGAEALSWYREAAAKGDETAMYLAGTALLRSSDSDDLAEAHRWLRAASDAEHAPSLTALGAAYLEGKGVERNAPEAMRLFRAAAALGDATAMANLGVAHLDGLGTAQDMKEGVRWLRGAAALGDARALTKFGDLHRLGTAAPEVPLDLGAAFARYSEAAELGFAPAMAHVGAMLVDGKGTARDEERGVEWLERAANAGVPEAMLNLAGCYRDGRGVDQNHATAYFWAAAGAGRVGEPLREGAERFASRIGESITFQRRLAVKKRIDEWSLAQVGSSRGEE
jgi:TPR repeat protein